MDAGAMDGRRRTSFSRQPAGGSGRPISASRRRGAEPPGPPWPKEHYQPPFVLARHGHDDRRADAPGGLTRQASAPTLAPQGGQNLSFDAFARSSPHGSAYDSFARSPALRRSSSAAAVGPRAASPTGQRPAHLSASVPRRKPCAYDSTPPMAYVTPEKGALRHRADALQLESRLTERLREHSLSSAEATRRPASTAADPRRHAPHWSGSPWHDPAAPSFDYGAAASPDGLAGRGGGYWPGQRGPQGPTWQHQGAEAHYPRQRPPTPSYDMFGGGNAAAAPSMMADESTASESRLKIYSDLFEEVIERDRVFGSLLRKIKTAYDMLLVKNSDHEIPPMPQQQMSAMGLLPPGPPPLVHGGNESSWVARHSAGDWQQAPDVSQSSVVGRPGGGPQSNEPTTRAEDGLQSWEMHRENRVLKDLVERLHLELEEAVKREHRWKQKVAKLKVRTDHAGPPRPPMPQDSWAAGYQRGMQAMQAPPPEESSSGQAKGTPAAPLRTFHASRREPTGPARQQEPEATNEGLNQGGLLSLSSISPQTSGNLAPEAAECTLASNESARSDDSGMLPQRPTRRHVLKPPHVPALDLSCLQQHLEEEEEEDEGEDPGDGAEELCAADGAEYLEQELYGACGEDGYLPQGLQEQHLSMYDLACDPNGQQLKQLR